jgi:hypothetical protein
MLLNFVIRPPRSTYPEDFKLNSKEYKETNFELKNNKGEKLKCTFVEPLDSKRPNPQMPCVIYMHGNAGNKIEGLSYADYLIP